jgi:hypothetical protein
MPKDAEAGASLLLLVINPDGLSETVGCIERADCQHFTHKNDLSDKWR